jgi:ribosomal protein S27AE
MDELPIEASVDEFVDTIIKETGDRVVCSACGNTDWATWTQTPLALGGSALRLDAPEADNLFGIHVVAFSCSRCGLIRFHNVDITFRQKSWRRNSPRLRPIDRVDLA